MESSKRRVYYIFDKQIKDATDRIPRIKLRSALVHALIKSFNLVPLCTVAPIEKASSDELLTFHTSNYIEHLKKAQESNDIEKVEQDEENIDFNLEYDCPLFENIYDFASIIAGGTLSASKLLSPVSESNSVAVHYNERPAPKSYLKFKQKQVGKNCASIYDLPGNLTLDEESLEEVSTPVKKIPKLMVERLVNENAEQNVVINWFGGWHHAQRDAAEGFCYVNDIVIGIQQLLKCYHHVLYIDLDVHHGNGVENAFAHTPHVMTFSLHKYALGFYPGSGNVNDVGMGPGKYYSVNVPLNDGITDGPYIQIFTDIANKIREVFDPDCLVIQCGADGLAGDPLGGFNLSLNGLGSCVQLLLDWSLPTLLLGGGGYNIANVARCYAYLTSIALRHKIPNDIPENDFFHLFGPSFELSVTPSLRKDENSPEYLQSVRNQVFSNLDNIKLKENIHVT